MGRPREQVPGSQSRIGSGAVGVTGLPDPSPSTKWKGRARYCLTTLPPSIFTR